MKCLIVIVYLFLLGGCETITSDRWEYAVALCTSSNSKVKEYWQDGSQYRIECESRATFIGDYK